jgi:hypothetical protein
MVRIPSSLLIHCLSDHPVFGCVGCVSSTSVMGYPQCTFIPLDTSPPRGSCTDDTTHQAHAACTDLEGRGIAADAVPLCSGRDNVIDGDHGLVRSIMLNDRIHVLTVDTSGEVAMWDVVRAESYIFPSESEMMMSPSYSLALIPTGR